MASTALGAVRRAVISPEDTLISAGGGVALALLRKAGQHILLNELSKFDEVRHGEVVVTSGCELPVAYIFHVAATLLRGDGSSLISESDVSQAVVNILSIAKSLDVRGLFMPLIGAGLEGMPPRRSLSAILQGIAKAERFATDELVQVAVVIRDEGTISRQEVGSCLEALASSGFDLRDCFADSATLSEE
jgi:O-acetyl-ADP-ribose deacetylase (regulator of RNase III)